MRVVKSPAGKVVTAFPTNVIRKIFIAIAIITNSLLQVSLKTQTTSTY